MIVRAAWPIPKARSHFVCGDLACFPVVSSKTWKSVCVLERNHLLAGPNGPNFWRSMICVFSDHAPAVIAISLPAPSRTAPSRTAPAPTPRRTARPTPTRAGKAVERATRSDPYPGSPHDPPAAPAAANDSSLLDKVGVGVGEAELSRRCARHGSRPIGSCAKRKRSRKGRDRECSLNHATPP